MLLGDIRHVGNCAPNRLSRCQQLVENVFWYVYFYDRIPATYIAWSQRSEKPRHICIAGSVPTHTHLGGPAMLQRRQLCSVETMVENIQGAIDVRAVIKNHCHVL